MSMTIEQAKSELMQIYGMLSPDKQRAIDTLVKIESCEDCISRKAVLDGIEELKKSPWATDKRGNGFEYLITEALYVVADLCIKQEPSVNPQEPKIGHWIEDDMTYCEVDLTNYKCDKCGEIGGSWRKGLKPDKLPKYCMNCGAKMERGDKE